MNLFASNLIRIQKEISEYFIRNIPLYLVTLLLNWSVFNVLLNFGLLVINQSKDILCYLQVLIYTIQIFGFSLQRIFTMWTSEILYNIVK